MKVWIVESGEYEERGLERVFATEDLAEAYIRDHNLLGEEPRAVTMWDRLPLPVTAYRYTAVSKGAEVYRAYKEEGEWLVSRDSWDTHESGDGISSRINWWKGHRFVGGPIYIEVVGECPEAVEAELSRLRGAVERGELTPA